MQNNRHRGPDTWVRRRPRSQGPGGRFVQDAAGNTIWVRTRATDPPQLVIDPALLDATITLADARTDATDPLLPVLFRDMPNRA